MNGSQNPPDGRAPTWTFQRSDLRAVIAACLLLGAGTLASGQEARDPLLDLMIQKGMVTQEEAKQVRAEADALRTNAPAMPSSASKWKISNAIKSIELYGDVRLRFEARQATTPDDTKMELDRARYAVRVGLRGDAFDNFYYGLRLETSANPRSTWLTFGGSSTTPFGKSNAGIDIGQAYIGWRPADWLDLTAGKMPNPMYTTPMVWDPDLNPEGAAERFKYTVGNADFFANFGQFLYQDNNPNYVSGSLLPYVAGTRQQTGTDNTFMLAWQGGVNYHFTKDVSAKIAATLYQYIGLVTNLSSASIGDHYIGESAYGGPNSPTPVNGLTRENGVYYNQVGLNQLLVVDVPFEVNFKIKKLNARVFGDFAYNLNGGERATEAYNSLAAQNQNTGGHPPLLGYGAQRNDVKAYQIGVGVGNGNNLGLVYGSVCKKNTWEVRTYWQHIEQYALDPNLLDSDFFEGRANLEGVFFAAAYGFTDNVIGTFRYGYASRINNKLGTGGSNLDIPEINPIQRYNLLQLDLTLKF
jgi:polyhydroxyalkanoate synthesis regulator phasin